ncbi:hypothetical protein LOZ53_003473 [Ophidiomyces ophidiicola]|nr:hypothetical protein LOZ53_003473 [Ophidiomyces ophidiicola]
MAIRFSRPPPPRRSRRLRVVIVGCFLALLLAFITIRNTWFPPPPLPIPPASEDIPRALVLAKTRWENVQWAHRLRPQWIPFVYSIDKEPGFPLRLPANRGREAMAYLTFIIDNYDTLPEITAFVHAKNYQWHNDGAGSRTAAILKNLYMSTVERKGYVNLRCNPDPGCPTAISPFSPTAEDIRTGDVRAHFPEVYMALLNVTRKEVPKRIGSVCCAQFALSRDRIRLRPRDDYIRMREWALTADFDSQTIGWVFEMIWHIIFKEDAVLNPEMEEDSVVFTREGMKGEALAQKLALVCLDEKIGKSKNLRKAAPIKFIVVGGFVAVTYFQNRDTTEDLDYMLDPSLENLGKVKEKLSRAIKTVAKRKGYDDDWVNDKVQVFALGDSAQPLFRDSMAQNIVLWSGKHLIIYAAKWGWSLARKVKRIGSTKRDADVSDAVVLLRKIVEETGKPIPRTRAKSWDQIVFTPIEDSALDRVAEEYEKRYGGPGFV